MKSHFEVLGFRTLTYFFFLEGRGKDPDSIFVELMNMIWRTGGGICLRSEEGHYTILVRRKGGTKTGIYTMVDIRKLSSEVLKVLHEEEGEISGKGKVEVEEGKVKSCGGERKSRRLLRCIGAGWDWRP